MRLIDYFERGHRLLPGPRLPHRQERRNQLSRGGQTQPPHRERADRGRARAWRPGGDPQPQQQPRLRGLDRRGARRRRLGRPRGARVGGRERLRHRPARGRVALLRFELRAGDRADSRPVPEAPAPRLPRPRRGGRALLRGLHRGPWRLSTGAPGRSRCGHQPLHLRRHHRPAQGRDVVEPDLGGLVRQRLRPPAHQEAARAPGRDLDGPRRRRLRLARHGLRRHHGLHPEGRSARCDGGDRPPRRDPHLHAADGDLHDARAPARQGFRLLQRSTTSFMAVRRCRPTRRRKPSTSSAPA